MFYLLKILGKSLLELFNVYSNSTVARRLIFMLFFCHLFVKSSANKTHGEKRWQKKRNDTLYQPHFITQYNGGNNDWITCMGKLLTLVSETIPVKERPETSILSQTSFLILMETCCRARVQALRSIFRSATLSSPSEICLDCSSTSSSNNFLSN